MTVLQESATTRRMGRPPLKRNVDTVLVALRLPADVVERIDERAGEGKRSEWLRRLITNELRRQVTRTPPSRPGSGTSRSEE